MALGRGFGGRGERVHSNVKGVPPSKGKGKTSDHVRNSWPLIREMVRPRRGLLLGGLALTVLSQICSMALPISTRFLVDNVLVRHQTELLKPLMLVVLVATSIQGATAYGLTQMLSMGGQRLIAEMRRKVQEHVGRLPVAYYDSNKTGMLVSRIMNDVEGVRNLIGTGLVDFIGGILKAVFSLVYLLWTGPLLTLMALIFMAVFSLVARTAFGRIRPIFRERGQITAEVTGRLTESLAGVRVVKGYHAERQEAGVFSAGVDRLLQNILRSLSGISLLTLSSTVLMGLVGASVMWVGAWQIIHGSLTLGGFMSFTYVPRIPGRAGIPDGGHRNADHGGAGRPGPHPGSAARKAGGRGTGPHALDRAH